MHRLARLARDAIGAAPREQAAVLAVCAVLAATGIGLLGAAAYHALAADLGAQVARLILGALALAAAGAVWAWERSRAAHRRRRARDARAQLARDLGAATPRSGDLGAAAVAFVAAFLAGRRR